MKNTHLKTTLALALIGAGLAAMPARSVEIAFSGSSNIGNLTTVTGEDGIGDTWQTHNGPEMLNSNFAMADLNATPQPFNPDNFSNGRGNWANSFQLTVNNSQLGVGFKGINLDPVASGMTNHFTVKPDLADTGSWIDWTIQYNLFDIPTQLFQQVLFTAPSGTSLEQGVNFEVNVNFAGIFTADSGWAASFDDRADLIVGEAVPEPGTFALMALGLLGFVACFKRKRS